jgi:hypothetical protein
MSSVNVDYFKPEIQTTVLKMAGLRTSAMRDKMVFVTDYTPIESGEKLISLHYNPDNLEKLQSKETNKQSDIDYINNLSSCRGKVFDISNPKNIVEVKRSYGQTVNLPIRQVPLEGLLPIPYFGSVVIPNSGIYKPCYGGSLLCSYFYNGKARLSTFRKLDASNSHFGDSDKFVDIWLKNQDIFPTVESLYPPGCDTSIKHLFIINDRKLLIDTRVIQERDHVVYIDSFSPTSPSGTVSLIPLIQEANVNAKKPIIICNPLTPEQVNSRLMGGSFTSADHSEDHDELVRKMSSFSGGEKVIYLNNIGIFTLVPKSSKFRQTIMDGKNNIDKLFVDCMSDIRNERGLIDIAFSISDLKNMDSDLQVGETVNIDNYTPIYGNRMLTVLTNLVFTVPLNRVQSAFNAFIEFETKLDECITYLIKRYNDLDKGIKDDKLATFNGITSVKLRNYLCHNIPDLDQVNTQPEEYWPEPALQAYKKFYSDYKQCEDNDRKCSNKIKMGIVGLVANSEGDLLYSLLTFESKVEKAEIALANRLLKASLHL